MKRKSTPKRAMNPTWLRKQIKELIEVCEDFIETEQAMADYNKWSEKAYLHHDRIENYKWCKARLESIIAGRTYNEDITHET